MTKLKEELLEIGIQLTGLGNYSDDNIQILEEIFEYRFKPIVYDLNKIDSSVFDGSMTSISEIQPNIELLVSKSFSRSRNIENYNNIKDHMKFAVNKAISYL